jgi:hypothetical protein
MENGRKFETINISLKIILKNIEAFNKFKGENLRDKSKVHPPPGKPEGKNSFEIISIKINKPGMVKIGSLVGEKSRPSFSIVIITIWNITIMKNSGRRMVSPIFFRNHSVKINTVVKYFLWNRSLAINCFKVEGFSLNQNISIKGKIFLRMLRNPMEIRGKIRKSFTGGSNGGTIHFNGKQMFEVGNYHLSRGFFIINIWNSGFLREIHKWVIRRSQSTRIRNR